MDPITLKLVLTPLLITAVMLTAQWLGPKAGGWLAGLPLTSAPVSAFLAFEQGTAFAANAAQGSLLSVVGIAAFATGYASAVSGGGILFASIRGVMLYAIAILLISPLPVGLLWAAFFALAGLSGAILGQDAGPARNTDSVSSLTAMPALGHMDIPLRATFATAMVVAITYGADTLGARWSGLLASFPVFACVMAVFIHRHLGPAATQSLLRALLNSTFAFIAFFVVVGLAIEKAGPLTAYACAAAAALITQAGVLSLTKHYEVLNCDRTV